MNSIALRRNKSIHILIILSFVCSIFVMPAPAEAGVLAKVWSFVKPVVKIGGHIGGAVAGATLASAIVPPLGTIVGGVAGWIVGGMIADYGSKSLSNLACVAAGAAGALALGPSAIGVVGGFILGGLVGKLAFSLLKKADNSITGGVVFSQAQSSSSGGGSVSGSSEALTPTASINSTGNSIKSSINNSVDKVTDKTTETLNKLEDKAKVAKDNLVRLAQEKYEKASAAYRETVEKAENSTIVTKAKQAMDTAKQALQQLLRK